MEAFSLIADLGFSIAAIIGGGFFFILLSEGFAAAVLLIFFRLIIDLLLIGIHRDSNNLDILLRKITKSEAEFLEAKKKLQEFSE